MRNYLHSAALFVICVLTAVPVLAVCPEGKSEVVIVTPRGISKTICVADKAIPGIENAADHSGVTVIPAICPCLDVWDGAPYPPAALVSGTPPVMPNDISGYTCEVIAHDEWYYFMSVVDISNHPHPRFSVIAEYDPDATPPQGGRCVGSTVLSQTHVWLSQPPMELFTDIVFNPPDPLDSAMMNACKLLLEERGCVFQLRP